MARDVIVGELNDLGEDQQLSYEQRTSEKGPFAPDAIRARRRTLSWWRWGLAGATAVWIVGMTALLIVMRDQVPLPGFLTGLLVGCGPGLALLLPRFVQFTRAEKMYDVLLQLDDAPAEESSTDASEPSPMAA